MVGTAHPTRLMDSCSFDFAQDKFRRNDKVQINLEINNRWFFICPGGGGAV